MITNTKYKDSVFRTIFNSKEKIRELYNTIYQTHYGEDTEIEIVTLEDVLFTPRKNDLAFVIENKFVVLIEHQSSINENMPLRLLLYVARLYEKITEKEDIYKRTLMKIPTPEFLVLYNGEDNLCIDRKVVTEKELRLSDAYRRKEEESSLELVVKVVNIGYNKKHKMLEKKSTLQEYSYFMQKIKDYQKEGKKIEKAVQEGIEDCIKQGILEEFLKRHSSEVFHMLTLEYKEETALKVREEEGRREGIQKGKREGKQEIARKMLKSGMKIEQIQEFTELSKKEIKQLKTELSGKK